jgi:gamma-glutamyl-gamma-aminobutyrate hydrolase PuuD
MKKIAITQRIIENNSYYEIRECLDIKYAKMFKKLGFLPIVLPIEYDFKLYFQSIKIDGIFLTGGNEVQHL